MSGAAVVIEKACDTTRIVGGNADGDPVGIGSGVRTSVVAVGSTVCTAEVAVALGVLGAVVEGALLGVAAGAVHPPRTITARAKADMRSPPRSTDLTSPSRSTTPRPTLDPGGHLSRRARLHGASGSASVA